MNWEDHQQLVARQKPKQPLLLDTALLTHPSVFNLRLRGLVMVTLALGSDGQ